MLCWSSPDNATTGNSVAYVQTCFLYRPPHRRGVVRDFASADRKINRCDLSPPTAPVVQEITRHWMFSRRIHKYLLNLMISFLFLPYISPAKRFRLSLQPFWSNLSGHCTKAHYPGYGKTTDFRDPSLRRLGSDRDVFLPYALFCRAMDTTCCRCGCNTTWNQHTYTAIHDLKYGWPASTWRR